MATTKHSYTRADRIRAMLANGWKPSEIAKHLKCSRQAVDSARKRTFRRMGRPVRILCPHCGEVIEPGPLGGLEG